MADIKSPEKRSINMSHIHSTDTHPELVFRKWLYADGFRYSLQNKTIPGHPDLWMRKYNVAVFIHGCFWHRHRGCKYAYTPKSRESFWTEKFEKNVIRDAHVKTELSIKGVRQLIIWECTVKKMERDQEFRKEILKRVKQFFISSEDSTEL